MNNEKNDKNNSNTETRHKIKAAVFLGSIASISAIIGFSKTLAVAKKQEYKVLEKAGPNAAILLEGGTALAMRALAWGSLFAILGTSSICFGIWKLSGAKNIQEFREKVGSKLPRITKDEPPTSRTEFDGLTDLIKYLATWVADYSGSSSSSEDEDDKNEKNENDQKSKFFLPSANVLLSSEKPGEVFSNPYKEAENAKIASLERHVKMVDSEYIKEKNGKKICWNYRKGRCRYGSSCTFAHDSDLQITDQQIIEEQQQIQNAIKDIPLKATISKPQIGLQVGASIYHYTNKFNSNVNGSSNSSSSSSSSISSSISMNNNCSTKLNQNDKINKNILVNNGFSNKNKRHLGLSDSSVVPSKKITKQNNTLKKNM